MSRHSLLVSVVAAVGVLGAAAPALADEVAPPVDAVVTLSGTPQVGGSMAWHLGGGDALPRHGRRPHVHWERCDVSGADCHRIPGRHGLAYRLQARDAWHRVRAHLIYKGRRRVDVLSAPSEVVVSNAVGETLLEDRFDGPDGLVANDYTTRNPAATDGVVSPLWQLSNGSLFRVGGTGWTGVPDNGVTRADGSGPTHSASFRLTTREADFGDVLVRLRVRRNGLTETSSTPAVRWDGAHVVLRYGGLQSFYVASVDRRDGLAVLKRKLPGGDAYGGRYRVLGGFVAHAVPQGTWQDAAALAHTNTDGSVTLAVWSDGRLLASATDQGADGAPPAVGRVGVYGDNADLNLDDVRVAALG